MAPEVALNTPLAEALTSAVQSKLSENGWVTGGPDDSALGEYVILMLANGKTQDQIATELSTDLLSLPPEDSGAVDFARWLFEQTERLNNQINGGGASAGTQQSSQGTSIKGAASRAAGGAGQNDSMATEAMEDVQDGAVPTGPKSMRSGMGNRNMMGQITKAMVRSNDASLHRVQGQQGGGRINTHNKMGRGRNFRQGNGRGMGGGSGNMGGAMMQMSPQQQMQLMAMMEQQAQMMASLLPPGQMMPGMGGPNGGGMNGNNNSRRNFRPRNNNHHNNSNHNSSQPDADKDQAMTGNAGEPTSSMEVEAPNPAESVCKFNLKCTKKDCQFAHQSPAAPPGTHVDVTDVCSYGAACKNKKCTGRHPSPYQKVAHAAEQDCKYFPFCSNPSCPFRHPSSMPLCKFGGDCSRAGCAFTHVSTLCKFNPCLNPECPYKHAEGQRRGKYGDKVWTSSEGNKDHVSERKFVDEQMMGENGQEELIKPDSLGGSAMATQALLDAAADGALGSDDDRASPEVVT